MLWIPFALNWLDAFPMNMENITAVTWFLGLAALGCAYYPDPEQE